MAQLQQEGWDSEPGAKADVLSVDVGLAARMYGQDHFDSLQSAALVYDVCHSGIRCSDGSMYVTLSAGKYG